MESIETAATTLRKAGFGKAFATISGSTRAARGLCETIGIDPSSTELDALAMHLRAVRAFEEDQDLARLLGPAWGGVGTPFEDILEGIKLRDLVYETLRLVGDRYAIPLSSEVLASLLAMVPVSERFLNLPHEAKARLDDTPVNRLLPDARRRIATLEEFLAVDPGHLLVGYEAPICRIAHAHALLKRRERVNSGLASHATADQVRTHGSSEERLSQMVQATAWFRSIYASRINETLRAALLTHKAAETRACIGHAAKEWAALVEKLKTARNELKQFEAESLGNMHGAELLPLLDELSSRDVELPDFITIRQARRRLELAGLAEFLEFCDRHAVEPKRISALFSAKAAESRASMARRSAIACLQEWHLA